MAEDIFDIEIQVGDTVALNRPSYKYLITGVVVKINPKTVRVQYSIGTKEKLLTDEFFKNVVVQLQKYKITLTLKGD